MEYFPATNALDCMILHIQITFFQAWCRRTPAEAPPGTWTYTPISPWLSIVPIVAVIRNDHWYWHNNLAATVIKNDEIIEKSKASK